MSVNQLSQNGQNQNQDERSFLRKFMYVCCWTFGGLVLLIGLLFFIVGLGITSEYWSGISQ
ncbi:MAG: hypothetical protein ACXAC8_19650, partial [Candidatus Hodarchaeales archaeon]